MAFGFPEADLNIEMFTTEGNIITFGVEPVRVDFINQISGVEFDEAWNNKVRGKYGKVEVNFIGRLELLKTNHQQTAPKINLTLMNCHVRPFRTFCYISKQT